MTSKPPTYKHIAKSVKSETTNNKQSLEERNGLQISTIGSKQFLCHQITPSVIAGILQHTTDACSLMEWKNR